MSAKASAVVGVFFCALGPIGGRTSAAARRGGHRQLNRKTPGKPHKSGHPGIFLDGRFRKDSRGPLGHAPEVTAADQEGVGFAALEDSIAGRRGKCKGAQRNNAPLER